MTKITQDDPAGKIAQIPPQADKNDEIHGEGNYSAARRFDAREREFVEKNRQKIPEMGKDAEKALDGPQGDDLRKADEEGRSHAKG